MNQLTSWGGTRVRERERGKHNHSTERGHEGEGQRQRQTEREAKNYPGRKRRGGKYASSEGRENHFTRAKAGARPTYGIPPLRTDGRAANEVTRARVNGGRLPGVPASLFRERAPCGRAFNPACGEGVERIISRASVCLQALVYTRAHLRARHGAQEAAEGKRYEARVLTRP